MDEDLNKIIGSLCSKYNIPISEIINLIKAIVNERKIQNIDIEKLDIGHHFYVTYIQKGKYGHSYHSKVTTDRQQFLTFLEKEGIIKYNK